MLYLRFIEKYWHQWPLFSNLREILSIIDIYGRLHSSTWWVVTGLFNPFCGRLLYLICGTSWHLLRPETHSSVFGAELLNLLGIRLTVCSTSSSFLSFWSFPHGPAPCHSSGSSSLNKDIGFPWEHGHVGIPSNVRADQVTRRTIEENDESKKKQLLNAWKKTGSVCRVWRWLVWGL